MILHCPKLKALPSAFLFTAFQAKIDKLRRRAGTIALPYLIRFHNLRWALPTTQFPFVLVLVIVIVIAQNLSGFTIAKSWNFN